MKLCPACCDELTRVGSCARCKKRITNPIIVEEPAVAVMEPGPKRIASWDEKLKADRFLGFLKSKGLSMAELEALPQERQSELRNEFLVEYGYRDPEPTPAEVARVIEQLEEPAPVQAPLTLAPPWDGGSTYDPERFRREINLALRSARKLLSNTEAKDFPGEKKGFPGVKALDDLKQIVDIEIWLASKKYGPEMNGAIAYTIAKNQARKFMKDQIEETMIVENPDGTPNLDKNGIPVRILRFPSFDEKLKNEEGKTLDISAVEKEIAARDDKAGLQYTWADEIILSVDAARAVPKLIALVNTWIGVKRTVAEALLRNPGMTVRDVPGVSKSTVARVLKVIMKEFRAAVGTQDVPENKGDIK